MALDVDLATEVLCQLLPRFVHQVKGFIFEHSPGRRQERFLNDGTAFDLAIQVITPDGEEGTIFVEQKYSEDMTGPAARLRDRYDEASRAVGLFADPDSQMLRSLALEQLWREHMLAQLVSIKASPHGPCLLRSAPGSIAGSWLPFVFTKTS